MKFKEATKHNLADKITDIMSDLVSKKVGEDDPEQLSLLDGKLLAYGYVMHLLDNGIPCSDEDKELLCGGCGGNSQECTCGQQPEYTLDDAGYFAAVWANPN